MHVSLDCTLNVGARVMAKAFSSGGEKRCTNVLGEGCLTLFAPQCDGLILKPNALNILMWIVSDFFSSG